jgi:hypothetical protein
MIEKSYEKINNILHRLEDRGKLRALAETIVENTNNSLVYEGEVQQDTCSTSKESFFVCNVKFKCIGANHRCSSNYILCPVDSGYVCYNEQQHGCNNSKKIFECATFLCGRKGMPPNNFGCAGQKYFFCNGNQAYECTFEFKCSEPSKSFLCTEKHSCNQNHNCGNGNTSQQLFLCGYDKKGNETYTCKSNFTCDTKNAENVGSFTCGDDTDFTCVAVNKFECTKNFGCRKANKFICENESKYTCKGSVTCNPNPYTKPPKP